MRSRIPLLTIGLLPLLSGLLVAQTPPTAADANAKLLDPLLARWEKQTQSLEMMAAEVSCSRKDPVFNKTTTLEGVAKYMKLPANGGHGLWLDLRDRNNRDGMEKYICTGTHVYSFRPEEKAIHVVTLDPQLGGKMPDVGALNLLLGMPANEAKKRYGLEVSKADDWYTYVNIKPNLPKDQADFTFAQITIMNRDYTDKDTKAVLVPKDLPIRIYWVEPNKTEVTWTIKRIEWNNPKFVNRQDFTAPDPRDPKGSEWKDWKLKAAPSASSEKPTPTIIRPQDKK